MDPARVEAWPRFFDTVVANGAAWPRHLWFSAVEDGLVAALGSGSPLVEAFRRDLAELRALERTRRPGSWQDEQRLAQLEAQIRTSVEQADAILRPAMPPAETAPARTASSEEDEEQDAFEVSRAAPLWPRALRASSFGLLLVGAGLLGGVYLYDARLAAQVGQELGRYTADLQQSIGIVERNLAAAMGAFEQESERVGQLQVELAADTTELRATITESLHAMRTLRETAVADLEARLAQEGNEVAAMVARLQERGAALDRGLDQVSADLAAAEQRVPELDQGFAALDERLAQERARLAETTGRVEALQAAVPELSKRVDAERAGLEHVLDDKRRALAELEAQMAALKAEFDLSGERLGAFGASIEQQLQQSRGDALTLQRTVEDLRADSETVADLIGNAETELERARAQTQDRIEAMLAELAEKADLTVMRGDDVLERGQAQATRRVEAASLEAVEALDRLRGEEIAGLAEQIAAARTELEETRAGLIASWQRMDRFVTERHNQLLLELDRRSQTIEARVQELLDALNVMVAESDQKKS